MSGSDSDSGPEDREPPSKVPKTSVTTSKKNTKKESEQSGVFKITSKRFVSVSEFKGKTRIDIREFYEDKDTEELKPGRKGISLSLDEWKKLLELSKDVNSYIESTE